MVKKNQSINQYTNTSITDKIIYKDNFTLNYSSYITQQQLNSMVKEINQSINIQIRA